MLEKAYQWDWIDSIRGLVMNPMMPYPLCRRLKIFWSSSGAQHSQQTHIHLTGYSGKSSSMWKALDGSTKITVLCSHKNTEYHCVTRWTNQFCLKCGNIKRYATTDSGVQKFPKFEMVLRAYVLIINSCCCQALFIVVIKQKCNLLISVSHKPLSMVCMCIFRTILGKNR